MQIELSDGHIQSLLNLLEFGIRNDQKEMKTLQKGVGDIESGITVMNEIKSVILSAKECQKECQKECEQKDQKADEVKEAIEGEQNPVTPDLVS